MVYSLEKQKLNHAYHFLTLRSAVPVHGALDYQFENIHKLGQFENLANPAAYATSLAPEIVTEFTKNKLSLAAFVAGALSC